MNDQLNNLPQELRLLPQWCYTSPDRNGKYKIPMGRNKTYAASNDPDTWLTFEDAVSLSEGKPIGFMLSANDPYAVIDIDTGYAFCDIAGQLQPDLALMRYEFHQRLLSYLNTAPTYSEITLSGYNYHTWHRLLDMSEIFAGIRVSRMPIKLPDGTHHTLDNAGIEIYSKERFIVCTGNSISLDTISLASTEFYTFLEKARKLTTRAGGSKASDSKPQVDTDVKVLSNLLGIDFDEDSYVSAIDVVTAITTEGNAFEETYRELFRGDMTDYPSQSEADYALIIAIAKISPNDPQVFRLFRLSALGKRPKAMDNDVYLQRSVNTARAEIKREESEMNEVRDFINSTRKAKEKKPEPRLLTQTATKSAILDVHGKPLVSTRVRQHKKAIMPDISDIVPEGTDLKLVGTENELDYPPALAGEHSNWLMEHAPQPMAEACIVNTLSLLAGIGGASYKINPIRPTGINSYFVLMSLSATGKDILHSGMGYIKKSMADVAPELIDFIDNNQYKSQSAIMQAIDVHKFDSFLHLIPEFSKLLHSANTVSHYAELLNFTLSAYTASSDGNELQGVRKSGFATGKAGAELKPRPNGFGYSFCGECTENDFNSALNNGMLRDGKLSRFICVRGDDYLTIGNPTNPHLPPKLKHNLAKAIKFSASGQKRMIHMTDRAQRLDQAYYVLMSDTLNQHRSVDDDPMRVVYNRARLKVWRVAGSLAMLENPDAPIITEEQYLWAMGLVNRDVSIMSYKIINRIVGDGADDHDRMDKVKSLIDDFTVYGYTHKEHDVLYGNALEKHGVVARRALRESVKYLPIFKNPRTGKSDVALIDSAIKNLVSEGVIKYYDAKASNANFGIRTECYSLQGKVK
jgi:hypothetical protein